MTQPNQEHPMSTATTARNLFPFVTEGAVITTNDGTEYVVSGGEHAGRYFLRAGAFDALVEPTDDDTDFSQWCSRYAPAPAHEDELELAVNELDGGVEYGVDVDIERAADAWVFHGAPRAIVVLDIDAITDSHNVRASFVVARARAIGVPVVG